MGCEAHLPNVGILVRGARQDVGPIGTEAGLDEEGGGDMTRECSCGPHARPEGVIQVVHTVAHTHKQPRACSI